MFSPLTPIEALYWSAVINGAVVGPRIGVMTWLAGREVMGSLALPGWLRGAGWVSAVAMGAVTLATLLG